MTTDLTLLVWSLLLTFVQALVPAIGANQRVGLVVLAGNREDLPTFTGWTGRAQRAHRNMLENIVLFAALVLVAHVAGKANATTALGAQIFFWARLAYAVVYVAGVPWVRTLLWVASVIGMALIVSQILG